jgi:hypothetical protein
MRHVLIAISLAATSAAAASAEPPRTLAPEEVPPDLAPALARADAAMGELRERLFARLNALLVQGGPISAIRVCSGEAPKIAKEIGEAHRVELGRTSFKVRNPANAPRRWAAEIVQASAGKKAAEGKPVVVDLGDRLGLLRPIGVMPACTRCHGATDGIDADVRAELSRAYPRDQATGFTAGDLRGFLWAEVKKR